MADCPHGMPKPETCYECMEEGNLKPVLPERVTPIDRLTIAKYDGQCSRCNLGIHVGQPIVMMSNDTWEHSHHHMAKEVWID